MTPAKPKKPVGGTLVSLSRLLPPLLLTLGLGGGAGLTGCRDADADAPSPRAGLDAGVAPRDAAIAPRDAFVPPTPRPIDAGLPRDGGIKQR